MKYFLNTLSVMLGTAVLSVGVTVLLIRWTPGIFGLEQMGMESTSIEATQIAEESSTINAVEEVGESVVSIVIKKEFDQLQFSPGGSSVQPELTQVGGGTGFIITEDGYIITNRHVVNDPSAEYVVVLQDGEEAEATVISSDPFNDLAVVKIERTGLPVAPLGDSDSLQLGQTVVAIGFSLAQYNNTVTRGIISGTGRTIIAGQTGQSEVLDDVIQTDAAINPGNSGGPLVNLNGEVVGINTAIDGNGSSIGFTIPINQAKSAIDSVQKHGRIIRPILGIRYVPVTVELATVNELSVDFGALVIKGSVAGQDAVVLGSAADLAGIQENDILIEIDGVRIDAENPLNRIIQEKTVGQTISVTIVRDGEEQVVEATLQEFVQ